MSKQIGEKVSDIDKVGKIPFPKSVPFVVVNVFFERFSTGGILGEFCSSKL
jgi:hypothetical protein